MARTSAMQQVLSNMVPVFPSGSQSPYYRKATNVVTSDGLRRRNACVAEKLEGNTGGDRSAARERFSNAVSECKSEGR